MAKRELGSRGEESGIFATGPPRWEKEFQVVLGAGEAVCVKGHTARVGALKGTVLSIGHSGLRKGVL